MNPTPQPPDQQPSEAEMRLASLFANLVLQHTELAMMLMGGGPPVEGDQPVFDLDHAQLVIDQLEMLEVKTRGNLSPTEAALLQQSLTRLRMAFVEAVNHSPAPAEPSPTPTAKPVEADEPEDSKKRFTKKY